MTLDEWNACTRVEEMLDFLTVNCFDLAHDRKVHLFGCACVRRVWDLLHDERSRRAVTFAEQLADSAANEAEVGSVFEQALDAANNAESPASEAAARAAMFLVTTRAWDAAWDASKKAAIAEMRQKGDEQFEHARAAQCEVLRCIIGPRPLGPINIPASLLTSEVVALAQDAYDNRDPHAGTLQRHRVFVLADALEQAGVPLDLVDHLRDETLRHYRGCHILDSLLRRQ